MQFTAIVECPECPTEHKIVFYFKTKEADSHAHKEQYCKCGAIFAAAAVIGSDLKPIPLYSVPFKRWDVE